MIRQVFALLLFAVFIPSILFAAEVKNSDVRQVGNRILFEFNLEGDQGEDAEVNLTLTIKGKNYSADQLHLDGDYGKTKAGKGKKIYWNVLRDFPKGMSGKVEWDLTAAGGASFKDKTTGIEMVFVKGGCYQMGCGSWTSDCDGDEKPVHEVCIDDFHIGKYEVTVGEFRKFVNDTSYRTEAEKGDGCYVYTGSKWEKDSNKNWRNPGFSQDDRHPVACVSWNDTKEYVNWANRKGDGKYRLPTEAEWEYAARSGGKSEKYSGSDDIDSVAWYTSNSGSRTHTVGTKSPNGLGIYDMSGNVWEWVQDWKDDNYYSNSPKNNPQGPSSGSRRVGRGGSWSNVARVVRTASRSISLPDNRYDDLGFRLARTR